MTNRKTQDLTQHRARIRNGLAAGETYEELMEALGWHGTKPDAFRDAIIRQLGIRPDRRHRAHAGTSKLSLPPRESAENAHQRYLARRAATGAETKEGENDGAA
jgi:hypothetical protein